MPGLALKGGRSDASEEGAAFVRGSVGSVCVFFPGSVVSCVAFYGLMDLCLLKATPARDDWTNTPP